MNLLVPYGKHYIEQADIDAVVDVLRSEQITQGPAIAAFEDAVAKYVGARFAVAVSSGTAGLHLAYLAAGVAPGNSIVTSAITFVASSNAAYYCGGSAHFVDIDRASINMSPESLERELSVLGNVQVVTPVHFAGLPCDMSSIRAIANKYNAHVIEDAAHALGAVYESGNRVGSCEHSLMTVFSFHPVKAIAAGEGGMITTNDEAVYRKLIRLRSHGINKLDDPFDCPEQTTVNGVIDPWYYEMQELGFNYRITDIQCALALSQLKKLGKFIQRRRELAERYDKAFEDIDVCQPAQKNKMSTSAHHLYVLNIDFGSLKLSRGEMIRELNSRGIGCQVHYIPVPSHPFYRKLGFLPDDYPNASRYYQQGLSIPLFYSLSDSDQDKVITEIKRLLR